jgi:hypothetical protein
MQKEIEAGRAAFYGKEYLSRSLKGAKTELGFQIKKRLEKEFPDK